MPHMEILRAVERAGQLTSRHLATQFAQLSLSDLEVHALMFVGGRKHTLVADIQRSFALRPSTLTHVLDRLEGRGYLKRRLNPEDRRSLLIVLTPEGKMVAATVIEILREIEGAIRARVRDEDLAGFRNVVEAVVEVTS